MKKLALNKETVRKLDSRELDNVQGGNDSMIYCLTIANTCVPLTFEPCVFTDRCPSDQRCKTWKC